ncbi:MAG: DNA-directed RNA polymerase [Candidatus Aenigmarchaeota archaeon]|nr:DNA-directed RNA polymerase [Candidatus Aenigmarchaeota archaeon]
MYRITTVSDRIRVPPEKFTSNLKESVKQSIKEKLVGILDPRVGIILSVIDIEKVGEGKIMANDPGVYYMATFKLLTYKPELHELVHGEVVDNAEYGSFVRIGPMDGLIHISQLMDDFVSYDNKNSVFLGKETKRTLKEGDKVKARIISVSFTEQNKVGLTMRQTGLGSVAWIEAEKKKKK